ncbi:hypothetical protein L596_019640 [Steinernema carpocapsae]|uniref:Uncharacterized protein n=1 Tax=Steinernema carpocapsae TaxID=34508 RepID=A0A4U5MR52_STECR|nr:hypothetical protein L596_019640 [Steinernema carpocapsae]
MKFGHGPAKIFKLGGDRNWNYDAVKTAVRYNTRVYQGEDPKSEAELKHRIRVVWNELPKDVVAGWICEFLPRVRAVIDQEGRQIQQFNRV